MISKIYHCSDQHLRLYKRHKEYEQVFKRLFQYIDETKDENSIIFLGGDLVHNKTDMSPELINVASNFLRRCADLLPTILIAGNHDANLSNSYRLDALTPIVNSLNHPNLHYWKESGVYKFNGVTFSVFGILDSKDKWVYANDIKARYKIALHHGPIIGSRTDLTTIESGNKVGIFDGFDLALLGDIHSQQFLNEERTIAYPGSLIQQNFGESLEGHGILVWDVRKKNSEFITIKNDYGFYTFHLINGRCDIPNNLPKNLRVRIKHENTDPSVLEEFIQKVSKKSTIIELVKQKSILSDSSNLSKQNILGNSRDVEYQNRIISDYLNAIGEITQEELNQVLELNREINSQLPIQVLTRSVVWKPVKLEFSNMFSYGEDNVIGFDNLRGSYGIFSQNAFGKSSILDVLTFVLHDKSTRANKASHILNNTKDTFRCKLQFELNGIQYFIERIGTKKPDGNVKVDVNFWHYNEDGEKVSLNGEDRDKTNYVIRNLLGNYDDFIMTALSTQYDNQNFVERTQRDRKELLYKFLDIFIYDDLYKLSKENSKEYQILIRELEKDNLHEKSSQLYQSIDKLQDELVIIDNSLDSLRVQIKEETANLFNLNKQFFPIDNQVDIEIVEQGLDKNFKLLQECVTQITENRESQRQKKDEFLKIQRQISEFESLDNPQIHLTQIESKISSKLSERDRIKSEISKCSKSEEHLKNHKYDPNCKFCIDNEFVKSAKSDIEALPNFKLKLGLVLNELEELKVLQEVLKNKLAIFNKKREFQETEIKLLNQIKIFEEQENSLKYKGRSIQDQIENLKIQKSEYIKNSETIEKNNSILQEIEVIKSRLELLEKQESKLQIEHRQKFSQIESKKSEYDVCIEKLEKYSHYLKKNRIYDLYTQALSRDGVPYKIVEAVLPVLENEVNLILNSIVNFTIRLEATDEKYIHAFIVYDGVNSWPIELSSGMERFILSLAFRCALSEITSLPRANFLAIDEGFGVLDSDNIMQMGKLFQYLKGQYDYLICISHIDSMKDLVDNQIKIEKNDGFSRLKYNDSI